MEVVAQVEGEVAPIQPPTHPVREEAVVNKTYVEVGLGIGIVASMAFDAARDQALELLDSRHLFEPNTTRLGVRRGSFLRGYMMEFIRLFAPGLNADDLASLAEPRAA